jgi:NADP-dependent 3-hydroxy acid dehydrogenase YdfG
LTDGSDRVLLVTGASGGLGEDLAERAARSGYRLVLVARRADRLRALTERIGAERALAISADVADWTDMTRVVDAAVDRFGRIDVAVANAGTAKPASFFGTGGDDPAEWRDMVLTNVYGTALTARAVLPALKESTGHLVIMGSVIGRIMRPGLYSATTWAVTAMAASIRAEAVGTGVRVTLLQPGVIDTGLLRDELRERPMLEPEVISRVVLFAIEQPPSVDVNEIVIRPTGTPADC